MSDREGEKNEKTEGGAAADGDDPRIAWLEKRTSTSFKHIKAEKFRASFLSESNR